MSFPPHLKNMYPQRTRSLHEQQSVSPMAPLQQQSSQAGSAQPWNKQTSVMSSYLAGQQQPASAISNNSLGTISSGSLRRGQQQAMDANVQLPPAPSEPPRRREKSRQAEFSPFAPGGSRQQPSSGQAGFFGSNGSAARSSVLSSSNQYEFEQQQPSQSAQQQNRGREESYLLESESGLPRYLIAYNQTSQSSIAMATSVLENTQEPYTDVFDWSVSLVDANNVDDESPDRVALQQLYRMPEFRSAMHDGVVLYDRIESMAYKEPNTIVQLIHAQKNMILAALVAREKQLRTAAEQGGGVGGPAVNPIGQQSVFRSHHCVTEPSRTTKTIDQVAARTVLGASVEEFVRRAEQEAERIQINPSSGIDVSGRRQRRGAGGGVGGDGDGGAYVGGGAGGAGHGPGRRQQQQGGDFAGNGEGTIQQISVSGKR